MSTRISSPLLLLMLAACGEPATDRQPAVTARIETPVQATQRPGVPCALAGAVSFAASCMVDRADAAGLVVLTMRHPDGGFRRLLVTQDGRGVTAADGADPATVAVIAGNLIEVSIADDRYRLPATIRGDVR